MTAWRRALAAWVSCSVGVVLVCSLVTGLLIRLAGISNHRPPKSKLNAAMSLGGMLTLGKDDRLERSIFTYALPLTSRSSSRAPVPTLSVTSSSIAVLWVKFPPLGLTSTTSRDMSLAYCWILAAPGPENDAVMCISRAGWDETELMAELRVAGAELQAARPSPAATTPTITYLR